MAALLTERQIQLVKESFILVKPIQETAAELFYARLFELDPSLRPLFGNDMKEQGRKLMSLISTAVSSLHTIDKLIPAVQALGSRHRGYGVMDHHFETVGNALIWTLARGLGPHFNDETREAWIKVYAILSEVMKSASHAQQAAAHAPEVSATAAVATAPAAKPAASPAPRHAPSPWKRFLQWFAH